ncbi:MAG: lysostaphin resistance A-like protein [Salinigranum sp.]
MATDRRPLRRIGVAVLLTLAGVVLSVLLSLPALLVSLGALAGFVALTVLGELGFAVAALGFVSVTRRGVDFLDLRAPTLRALGVVVLGTVGMFVFRIVALVAVQALGLPVAGNAITEYPGVDLASILLVLIPVSVIVVGPSEELLFRGVVQRYLSEGFAESTAILLTGALFSMVHLPTTVAADANPLAVVVTLVLLFGLSLVLSYLYVWTDNLAVPILVHGLYDASIFALAYLAVSLQKLPTVAGILLAVR